MTDEPEPEPEPLAVPAGRPHLPPWLAYGGVALCVLLLAAFLVVQFVLPPSDVAPPPPDPNEIVYTPPVVEEKPPVVEEKPPVVEEKPPVVEEKPPVVEEKPPVVEEKPPIQDQPKDVAAFSQELRKAQQLWDASKYEEARSTVEAAVKAYTDLDGRAATFLTQIKNRLELVTAAFDDGMKNAGAVADAGQWFVALDRASTAARIYPEEGARRLPAFGENIHTKLRDEPMIPIVGRTVRLGEKDSVRFPPRDVTLGDFSIEPTEVTIEKYAVFCILTKRTFPAAWGGRVPAQLLNHPVAWVTLADAEAYAAWLGRRLPTADEWELTARYVDERPYPWGPRFQLTADEPLRANTREYGLRRGGFVGGTTPVGDFPDGASPMGVLDLAGNVWEWTATSVTESGFVYAVQKGGSFLTPEATARAANGLIEDPAQPHHDAGFRCAR